MKQQAIDFKSDTRCYWIGAPALSLAESMRVKASCAHGQLADADDVRN